MAFKDWLRGTWKKVKAWLAYNPSKVPKLPPPKVVTLPEPKAPPKSWGTPAGTPFDPTSPAAPPAASAKKKKPQPKPIDPWATGTLLKLSPEELRARAMKIQPWKTEWIGRVDVIPPQGDERTALIDRGLVLRGFFTEEELAEIHELGDLWLEHHEAAKLAKARAAQNADAAIAALRQEEAERKAEKKRLAKERREKRRAAIEHRKKTDIVFLGRGVSGRLGDRRAHVEKLGAAGLPVLATPADVAQALGLQIPKLRWLAFASDAPERSHYVQFEVPKRRGGTRVLASPKRDMRAAQSWILENILSKVPLHDAAHGFVPGRSTKTCAAPHRGRPVVVNLDLKDFFPSILLRRVSGFFEALGYSPAAATILGLLCTASPRRTVRYDGVSFEVAVGDRALPQGACTSPALSNLIAKRLDARLAGLAKARGFVYTRYADDLTFSGPKDEVPRLLARIRHVVDEEGFVVHPDKTRVQRKGGRQMVTGIVVNDKARLTLRRDEVRKLRAILHNAKKTGLKAQNRDQHPDFVAHLRGKIAYLGMVDRARADEFTTALEALL